MLDDNRGGTMLGIVIIGLFTFVLGGLAGTFFAPDNSECIEAYEVTLQDHRDLLAETGVTMQNIITGWSYDTSYWESTLRTAERSYDDLERLDCGTS